MTFPNITLDKSSPWVKIGGLVIALVYGILRLVGGILPEDEDIQKYMDAIAVIIAAIAPSAAVRTTQPEAPKK